ncbi:uncharacterized protein LOC133319348 [Danaus plexippus]|uniref:uncharacterized protein LOC133319348 n=1 Tax=Danaus plexippus TaxID=13037 RepID=UPI002AB10DB3|nr:uncharacterized protein LOC133319348 [Danaus plexippus]
MDVSLMDFECFEQQFTDLISEFQTLSTTESHLRNAVRAEAVRAEAAEAARDAALRASAESQASAAAATAGAEQTARALAAVQDELVTIKMQYDLADRQRTLFEENCIELNNKLNQAETELEQLRPLQTSYKTLQQQFVDLQKRIQKATEDADNEARSLESELRRVSRCAGGGSEVRERARLAAAAHARDKRLAADEMRHTMRELQHMSKNITNEFYNLSQLFVAEIARLTTVIVELEGQLCKQEEIKANKDDVEDVISELKAALEAERNDTARLQKTLAKALSDNATLASELHNNDNDAQARITSPSNSPHSHDCPIDSFLAE